MTTRAKSSPNWSVCGALLGAGLTGVFSMIWLGEAGFRTAVIFLLLAIIAGILGLSHDRELEK